jgi:hypothetical protein
MAGGPILAAAMLAFLSASNAAELDGIPMPDRQTVGDTRLLLNGIGLQALSIFRVRIYVAGLYLEQQSDHPDRIIHSNGLKLLIMRFFHDVSAEQARNAWREGFEQNCQLPCYLNPGKVQGFLAAVPPVQKGDVTVLLFTSKGIEASHNGRLVGSVDDPHFAEIALATFIGPAPPTPRLKRELLKLKE